MIDFVHQKGVFVHQGLTEEKNLPNLFAEIDIGD